MIPILNFYGLKLRKSFFCLKLGMAQTTFESAHWLSDEECVARGVAPHQVEMYRRYHYQQVCDIFFWFFIVISYNF